MNIVDSDQLDVLKTFRDAMHSKLAHHASKGDWKDVPISALLRKLAEEVDELKGAIDMDNRVEVLLEAADVALTAMMIADIMLGSPRPVEGRSRGDGR